MNAIMHQLTAIYDFFMEAVSFMVMWYRLGVVQGNILSRFIESSPSLTEVLVISKGAYRSQVVFKYGELVEVHNNTNE